MECERCKKNKATVFLTQVIDGRLRKMDLCEACAKELGVADLSTFSIADLLLDAADEKNLLQKTEAVEDLFCPACGYTLEALKETSKLGCAECYNVFSEYIALEEYHRATLHRGKTPRRRIQKIASTRQLTDLEKKLKETIQAENFEEAAWLRDQIRSLKA